jgi:hypothetical protein
MTYRRIALAGLFVALLFAAPVLGQAPTGRKMPLTEVLALEVPTDKFTTPVTLQDALGLMYDILASQGLDVRIVFNEGSFKELNPDIQMPLDTPVRALPVPKTLPLEKLLEVALGQLPMPAGMVLHGNTIEIVAREHATLPFLLWQRVLAKFDETPLDRALHQLSDKTGVSIVLDPRIKERKATPITVEFRRDVNLESALRMLANMAELKIVLLDRGVYVTTPENAATMEQELKNRRDERRQNREFDPERHRLPEAVSVPRRTRQVAVKR